MATVTVIECDRCRSRDNVGRRRSGADLCGPCACAELDRIGDGDGAGSADVSAADDPGNGAHPALREIRAERARLEIALARRQAPEPKPTPLMERLELLREQHGPVFVIEAPGPFVAGQRIKYGKNQNDVEVLGPVIEAGQDGTVAAGRWYGKIVE